MRRQSTRIAGESDSLFPNICEGIVIDDRGIIPLLTEILRNPCVQVYNLNVPLLLRGAYLAEILFDVCRQISGKCSEKDLLLICEL